MNFHDIKLDHFLGISWKFTNVREKRSKLISWILTNGGENFKMLNQIHQGTII